MRRMAGAGLLVRTVAAAMAATGGLTALSTIPDASASPSAGTLYAWGDNDAGQLGIGSLNGYFPTPAPVHLPAGTVITSAGAGQSHSVAATSTGQVYSWGYNKVGQLGDGNAVATTAPVLTSIPGGVSIATVAAGFKQSLAVSTTGVAYAWGSNTNGQLGVGTTKNVMVPTAVQLPAGVVASSVAGGDSHSLVLTTAGAVYAAGLGSSGQLGDGLLTQSATPVKVHLPAGVHASEVAAGDDHGLALTATGQVYAWGDNTYGELGNATNTSSDVPVPVQLPVGVTVTQVAAGSTYSVALSSTGQVYAWGDNAEATLGDGGTADSNVPVAVELPPSVFVTSVTAGGNRCQALTSTGVVYNWGTNENGTNADPVPVLTNPPGDGAVLTALFDGPEAEQYLALTVPAGPRPPVNAWPEAHHDPALTGVSGDPVINDVTAPQLGVRWMENLTSASLTSSVVGWNAVLNRTVAYVGDEAGYFSAFDEATGATLWSIALGNPVRATPVLDGNYIWVANTYAPDLFKIDASTGQILCSTPIYAVAEAAPIVVTPPGGSPTVFMGSNDLGTESGPLYSINESTCAVNWAFTGYAETSGLWDFISYAVDATGEPLVLFGTADPDAGVYAIDANTGAEVWRFQTYNPDQGPADIGAGVTVSGPGVNGFADGMAYVPSKDGNLYALDLTTGQQVWVYNYAGGLFPPVGNGSRATAALTGNQLIMGTSTGVDDVNAVTGTLVWQQPLPNNNEALGAPLIAGPAGHQVVVYTDVVGYISVLSLATGQPLYTYQTRNYVASSPAEVDGNLLVTSADGFLYDFALGGGNATPPTTAVTVPANGSTVRNPDGTLWIHGTATDPTGVAGVEVDVQIDGSTGQWWDAATGTWAGGAVANLAKVLHPGATSTAWSLPVPMPARGTTVLVKAAAVGASGVADTSSNGSAASPSRSAFTVAFSTTSPTLQLDATRVPEGSTITLTGGGFAPNESVQLTLPTVPVSTITTTTATGTGTFSTTGTLPLKLPFGPISVLATGLTSGSTSSATVTIANDSPSGGRRRPRPASRATTRPSTTTWPPTAAIS